MTKSKAKQPLESFDPRLLQLLIAGARSRLVIPFPGIVGRARAHSFQRRLHTLRSRMRQENHEHATLSSRCVARLFWGSKAVDQHLVPEADRLAWINDPTGKLGAILVIEPTDAQFDDVLSAIDIGPKAPPLETKILQSEEPLSLDDIFSHLEGEK